MNGRGQICIEALLALLAFLALLSLFVSLLEAETGRTELAAEALDAEAQAQHCSLLVDALYSNNSGSIAFETACRATGAHRITCAAGGRSKEEFVLAPRAASVQAGNKTLIEVGTNDHYR